MRKSFIIAAVLVAALTSCQKEVQEISGAGENVLRATREAFTDDATRALIDDNGAFTWTSGDQISVYDGKSKWAPYKTADGGSSSATFSGSGTPSGYAYYPFIGTGLKNNAPSYDEIKGELTVNLPSSYEWEANQTNVPMLATFDDASKGLTFKHLGGLVKFTFKGVTANDGSVDFWTTDAEGVNQKISGSFTVAADGHISTSAAEAEDKVTVSFKAADVPETGEMAFYFPVPAGSHVFNVEFKSGKTDVPVYGTKAQTIERRTFKKISPFTISSVDGGSESKAVSTLTVDKAVSGTLYLPSTTGVVDVKFNAAQTQALILAYDPLGDKPGSVNISAGDYTVANLTLNLGSSTVTLVDGTFTTLTATTAANTLVVNQNVKIGTKLDVKAGNLVFNGMTNNSADVIINNATSSVTVGTYDNGNGRIAKLTLNYCDSVIVAGTVANIGGSAASTVLVKTSGTVLGSSNTGINVYKEYDGTTTGAFTGLCNKQTLLNLAGLKSKIDDAKANALTLNNGEAFSESDPVEISKSIDITLQNNEVSASFEVKKGATLTLLGSGTLRGDINVESGAAVKLSSASVALNGDITNAGTLTLTAATINGDIKNDGKLTVTSATLGGVIDNSAAQSFAVASGVDLPEVIEKNGSSRIAYVTDADGLTDAINDANEDKTWKFSKIVVNNALNTVGQTFAIGSAKSASRALEIELRGNITMSSVDAFKIENADVEFTAAQVKADGTAESGKTYTITAEGNSTFSLTGKSSDADAKDYTTLKLNAGVILSGANAIKVASNNSFGIVVTSYADLSVAGIDASAGNATASSLNAPVFNLWGGSVKSINAGKYAVWNLEGVSVSNNAAAAIDLKAGTMTIDGTYASEDWTTKVTGTGQIAIAVSGGATLKVNGGAITGTTAVDLDKGAVTVTGGTISGTTAFDIVNDNTAVTLSISGATVSGKFTLSEAASAAKAVKGFIHSGSFDDLSALNLGEDGKTVNIKLAKGASDASYTVDAGKVVVLDLNGKTVTSSSANTFTVAYGGSLTITDTDESGNGAVANTEANKVCILNNGIVVLNGGKYGRIINRGESMTITGATVTSDVAGALIQNGYDNYVSEYTEKNAEEAVSYAYPKLIIQSGTFSATSNVASIVNNADGGVLVINGGEFSNSVSGEACILNSHKVTITDKSDVNLKAESGTVLKSAAAYGNSDYGQAIEYDYRKGEMTVSATKASCFAGSLVGPDAKEYGKLVIEGGQYSANPEEFVDTKGYTVTPVTVPSGTMYTVTKTAE